MLSFRDIVLIGAVVALLLWWFQRRKRCGCAKPEPLPAAAPGQPAAPQARKRCWFDACGGRRAA